MNRYHATRSEKSLQKGSDMAKQTEFDGLDKHAREAPDLKELQECARRGYRYNFDQASRVLEGMDALRQQAAKAGIPEIVTVVDAAFRILLTSYYSIVRNEMTKLQGTEDLGKARRKRVSGGRGRRRT